MTAKIAEFAETSETYKRTEIVETIENLRLDLNAKKCRGRQDSPDCQFCREI